MHLNRAKHLFLAAPIAVLAVFAISAVGAASASAACYRVAVAATGHWENGACTVVGTTKEFVKVSTLTGGTELAPGEWCAKVEAGEPSTYSNNTCTTTKTGTGEYTKVIIAPTWRKGGVALANGTKQKIIINSDTSRLWSPKAAVPLVVVCKKDKGTGVIENVAGGGGVDTAVVKYEECEAWSTTENTPKQIIQKEKTICKVPTIEVKTKSKLAYVPGSNNKEVVDVFEPESGTTFATIVFEECSLEGSYKVTGSAVGKIPRIQTAATPTEEAVQGDVLFETKNEPAAKTVEQRYKEYELGGVNTTDTLELGAKPAAFETTEVTELEPNAAVPFGPEPFGVHN